MDFQKLLDHLDVVKPETYWINDQFGLRCYSRNVPSFSSAVVQENANVQVIPRTDGENGKFLRFL